ncbi:MAG: lectin like domain-containing protein [Coprococcus sp.]
MKHLKRFILFALVLGIGGILWYKAPVTHFRGQDSQALTQHYNAIKAEDINSKEILLYLDGQPAEPDRDRKIWMSDELSLMIPDVMVNDLFQCEAAWLDNDVIRLTKDQKWIDIDEAKQDDNGQLCLSANLLADFFGYTYSWDEETNTAHITSAISEKLNLPEKYDLRDYNKVSDVRDQGSWGTCWAFASLSALESSLLPEEKWQFSVDHLVLENGFQANVAEGGDYNMALAYLTGWKGPVKEDEDPYGDGQSVPGLEAAVHLQEAVIINERDYDQIKSLICRYGAVQSAIYSQPDISELSEYYSEENAAYYYPDSMECNHDIVIIGWDDNYPKENFTTQPEGDGAFICKNSWGADFGQDGYFYISYYDRNIGIYGVAYTNVEPAGNYDRLFQSDLLGWTGSIGYNEPNAWFASVYETERDSSMRAVGFYATDADTYYDIYVVHNFDSIEDMDRRQIVQSGYIQDKGFYTIDLEQPQELEADERFSVIVDIYTKDSMHPIAIEYASNNLTAGVDISDGESYMSYNGKMWSHMEAASECNACLKVYVDFVE